MKKDIETIMVTARMPITLVNRLKKYAERQERTVTYMLTKMVEGALQKTK